jgi:type IV pilus assembly protein PilB
LRLGELLLEDGLVTPEQLENALSLQKSRGGLLGAALVELGYLSEAALAGALARRYGIATVDVSETLPERRLVRDFFARVPRERAAQLKVIPLARRGRTLTLAMADPTNVAVIDEVVSRTGFVVEPVHASARAILEGLDGLEGLAAYRAQWRPRFPRSPRLDKTVDFLMGTDTSSLSFADRPSTSRHLAESKEGALVSAILVDGARSGASYIHVDFEWTAFRVRYRSKELVRVPRANREVLAVTRGRLLAGHHGISPPGAPGRGLLSPSERDARDSLRHRRRRPRSRLRGFVSLVRRERSDRAPPRRREGTEG